MRTPTILKEPELEFPAPPTAGRRTSTRWLVVFNRTCRLIVENTPLAPAILIGSAEGTPRAIVPEVPHANTPPLPLDGTRSEKPPIVQAPTPLSVVGIDVI